MGILVYQCPGATVTNLHKLGGFKAEKGVVLWYWKPEMWGKKGASKSLLSGDCRGHAFWHLSQPLACSLLSLLHTATLSSFVGVLAFGFSHMRVFVKTLRVSSSCQARATSSAQDPQFNYFCKILFKEDKSPPPSFRSRD